MQINIGYFYFIKDSFFNLIDDNKLIIYKANKVLNLYNHGMKNIIFPSIDKILNKLLNFIYKAWFFRVKDIL